MLHQETALLALISIQAGTFLLRNTEKNITGEERYYVNGFNIHIKAHLYDMHVLLSQDILMSV